MLTIYDVMHANEDREGGLKMLDQLYKENPDDLQVQARYMLSLIHI